MRTTRLWHASLALHPRGSAAMGGRSTQATAVRPRRTETVGAHAQLFCHPTRWCGHRVAEIQAVAEMEIAGTPKTQRQRVDHSGGQHSHVPIVAHLAADLGGS